MPKRTDIESILVIGSGPIVIGQACEFDYSGTQALKALKEEGYRVILANSNPATIMTDRIYSDATYIEPLSVDMVTKIIEREKPDALLSTMGGQTALNIAMDLNRKGVLDAYKIEVIGANIQSIEKAENREHFKAAMNKIGVPQPKNFYVRSLAEAKDIKQEVGLPAIIRPSYTLGGAGASVAYNDVEYENMILAGLHASPVGEVLVDESILGWKEFELEMMRDRNDNVVVICSIENLDPVGVHTGDSITVAPAQTLSDVEYQQMRNYSLDIMREIGVDSGGSNIQYAVDPKDGKIAVIEMNPRVSRSSALASKATGYPIAKIAAKLAVGYSLDELPNDITQSTRASFEPVIDYVVTKVPRFDFAKFPQTDRNLSPQMKSVGEVMSIGRTFAESLQKAFCSLEMNMNGLGKLLPQSPQPSSKELLAKIRTATPGRLTLLAEILKHGVSVEEVCEATGIDPWFVHQIALILKKEEEIKNSATETSAEQLMDWKRWGFSDERIAKLTGKTEAEVRRQRIQNKVIPVYKTVDTCAAEFEAQTNYVYSSYGYEDEVTPSQNKKVVILGSGPNRIGQGVEFDYCCVKASLALRQRGVESIMVNCNPETVSTDFDISDRLYFEPLSEEYVMNILEKEQPDGVILQLGGQTPLRLAEYLDQTPFKILGTSFDSIDIAEDRERFKNLLEGLGIKQAKSEIVKGFTDVVKAAERVGYPIVVRPSYVLGGRAMEIVYEEKELLDYLTRHVSFAQDQSILVDHYLENSIEIDVDAISDGERSFVAGIMEHVEQAGVHSGDSSCVLPPFSVSEENVERITEQTQKIARALNVKGFLNIQFALQNDELYVLEVNPRASRTIPFVSKAKGIDLVDEAVGVLLGEELQPDTLNRKSSQKHYSVKSPVFPFLKFPKADTLLGPEMKSTGESMGNDPMWEVAFAKAQIGAGNILPTEGVVFISVNDRDKAGVLEIARQMRSNGFEIVATRGTADFLIHNGIPAEKVNKVVEGRPHIVDRILNGDVHLVFNTTMGKSSIRDSYSIRRSTLEKGIPYFTTVQGSLAASKAIESIKKGALLPYSLQQLTESTQ